jgi:type IX secretion system PorP/SprF family membrane protein
MKRLLLLFGLVMALGRQTVSAQQDPLYSLYLTNPITINPAYSGVNDRFIGYVNSRLQWAGFDGNPKTHAFGAHTSVRNNRMGLGVQFVQDNIGENSNTAFGFSYAYRLPLKEGTLSFGMQAGMINYKSNNGDLLIRQPNDPAFANFSEVKFNAGAGFLYKNERTMIGISVPRLINNAVRLGGQDISVYEQHYYVFTSRLFYINENLSFKPAVLAKAVKGSPLSADVNLNFLIQNKFTIGAYTRNLNAYGVLAQLDFLQAYRMAYIFEVPSGKALETRFTTHEIMLSINLALFDFHDRSMSNF